MAFIGVSPVTNFETTTAVQRFNGDGSDTTFTLSRTVSSVQDVLVSVDGVVDRKSTRLNSSHGYISYAVFCLKKKKQRNQDIMGMNGEQSDFTLICITMVHNRTH